MTCGLSVFWSSTHPIDHHYAVRPEQRFAWNKRHVFVVVVRPHTMCTLSVLRNILHLQALVLKITIQASKEITERFAVCRCLYCRHAIVPCQLFAHHAPTEKTVWVGHMCPEHSTKSTAKALLEPSQLSSLTLILRMGNGTIVRDTTLQ